MQELKQNTMKIFAFTEIGMKASPMLLIKSMMVTIAIDKWGGLSTNSGSMCYISMSVCACVSVCTRVGFAFILSIQSHTVCVLK